MTTKRTADLPQKSVNFPDSLERWPISVFGVDLGPLPRKNQEKRVPTNILTRRDPKFALLRPVTKRSNRASPSNEVKRTGWKGSKKKET